MEKRAVLLIVMLLKFSCIIATKVKNCDDSITETTAGTAYWKFRGTRYTTSEDYHCWKEHWEPFLRECNTTTGQWQPESVVCKVQDETNKFCPEDLVEIYIDDGDTICLNISTEPHKYDDNFCHGSNIVIPYDLSKLQTSHFIQYLHNRNLNNFWLPLRREHNCMPYQVRLPGERWGQAVDEDIKIEDYRSDKKCISARLAKKNEDELEIIMTDCDDILYSICVFQGNIIASSGCPNGLGALSYRPNECFGVNWQKLTHEEQHEIRIKEYFLNRNSLRLVLKKCLPKEYRNDFFKIDQFVGNSGDEYVILMNKNEMLQVVNSGSREYPVIYKDIINIQPNSVQLILKIDATLQELILIVYNRNYLWRINDDDYGVKCFTNADYDLLRSTKIDLIWENKSRSKSIFKLKLVTDAPGEYWCEGHTISNFQFMKTPRIVTAKKKRGYAFAIRINSTCLVMDTNIFTNMCKNINKYAKKIGKNLHKILREKSKAVSRDLVIHNARIMSIEQIARKHIDCWIHLTASLKSTMGKSDEESSEEDTILKPDERIRHHTLLRTQVWTILKELNFIENLSSLNVIRSTEHCFFEIFHLDNDETYQWKQTVRGKVGILSSLCLQSNGMPYTRQCIGNFTHGAFWESVKTNVSCEPKLCNGKITKNLYSLENSKMLKDSPEKAVAELKNILQEHAKEFIPVDLHFAANILQASVKYLDQPVLYLPTNIITAEHSRRPAVLKETTRDLIAIYNYLMAVNATTIKMSAQLNSTNKLLESFEIAMNILSSQIIFDVNNLNTFAGHGYSDELESNIDFESFDYDDIGVSVKVSSNLLYFVINPSIANISGVALFQNDNSTDLFQILKGDFKNEHYQFLQSNHEMEDFIYDPNLQFASYVPEKLLNNLDTIPNAVNTTEKKNIIVVIKVYSNGKLFQPQVKNKPMTALGRVVSISLPGHSSHLPEDLPLAFRAWKNGLNRHNTTTQVCSYWNYENWVSDGIQVINLSEISEDIVVCQVSHLTPFAYLVGFNLTVDDDIEVKIRQVHEQVLDIITLTGCSLSLLGISGIFITAAVFNSWRKKPSSKVLLQLSAAIALQMIILCFVNTKEYSLHLIISDILPSCVAIGALLHYSVLVQFFWMIVIAYLQFKRFVQVFGQTRPNRLFLKSTAFCWGVPVIPVVLVVVLDHDSFSKGSICYPSGNALYFGILLPISIIIIANFVIFCLIIYNILLVRSNISIRHTDNPVLIYQIRLSVLLFFLLGFTWCFGILTIIKGGIVFSYFFCLTATLQGLVIFIYFVILDPVTRRMWGGFFGRLCLNDKNSLQSTVSLKDTSTTL